MPNFDAQPMRNAAGEMVNPLTGETVYECGSRLHRAAIRSSDGGVDTLAVAREQAELYARSNMAVQDRRLAQFYAAVAAHLSEG